MSKFLSAGRHVALAIALVFVASTAASCVVRTGPGRTRRGVHRSGKHRHNHCHRRGRKGKRKCHSHPHRHSHH